MKKTATLTFHASHNYGSMLQAYALQKILQNKIGVDNEILNLRTARQKKIYGYPTECPKTLIGLCSFICRIPNLRDLVKKFNLFEDFLAHDLKISPEFSSMEQLRDYVANFDCLIAGSDQIWNTSCADFDWSYFLPFEDVSKISYSPSMGPHGQEQFSKENYSKACKYLKDFNAISVRETGTANIVADITGFRPTILIDPTMLLDNTAWEQLSAVSNPIKKKYIFLYHPFPTMELCKIANEIAKKTGLTVISSNKLPTKALVEYSVHTGGQLAQNLAVGPKEFVRLLRDSEFVISGSFHAVVFSILFHKPFLAYNGLSDNRMSEILSATGLDELAITADNFLEKTEQFERVDFSQADEHIAKERIRSVEYLRKSINL